MDFFNEEQRPQRLASADSWLEENWKSICEELENANSEVSVALLGHMRREFFYYWLREDPQWTAQWYSPAEEARQLPSSVKSRILREISTLANNYGINNKGEVFVNWIEQCVTTHYRIFAEYWLYLGAETGDEYMPALTRSSLRFLNRSLGSSVAMLVVPFVALAAIEKVKQRADLVPRIVEWTEGPGRRVVEGLYELQSIVRSKREPDQEKKILLDVEAILSSEYSRGFLVTLNLNRLATSALKQDPDTTAAQNVARLTRSNAYRWLWSIREPDVQVRWRKRVRELLGSSHYVR